MDRQPGITPQTKLLGLIGHPVSHSLSPVFHNAALDYLNLDYVYLAFDVLPENLTAAVRALRALGIIGFNVTVPHKETIITLLDEWDEPARSLQAVNTIILHHGRLTGYNTDEYGFTQALNRHQVNVKGKTAIILGAGGAARAVLAAMIQKQIQKILICNRSSDRAFQFQRWAQSAFCFKVGIIPWDHFINGSAADLSGVDILINATCLGLQQENISVPWKKIDNCQYIIDVVYFRDETPLVKEARKWGKIAFDGKLMLLYQGVKSFQLFTNHEAPVMVMEEVLCRVFKNPNVSNQHIEETVSHGNEHPQF